MPVKKDLSGKTFGRLTVISQYAGPQKWNGQQLRWDCLCSCGKTVVVIGDSLRRGATTSCGCRNDEVRRDRIKIEPGNTYGRLTAIKRDEKTNNGGHVFWFCRCECGNTKVINGKSLRNGATLSCGCLSVEKTIERSTKHGHCAHKSKTHTAHRHMVERCYYSRCRSFKNYGGRGITVCNRWRYGDGGKSGFECFLQDMGDAPPDMELDRINNNGNYEPDNCRRTPRQQNKRNTRRNRPIIANGKALLLCEWSEITGIPQDLMKSRIHKLKWSVEDAVTVPPKRGNKLYKNGVRENV